MDGRRQHHRLHLLPKPAQPEPPTQGRGRDHGANDAARAASVARAVRRSRRGEGAGAWRFLGLHAGWRVGDGGVIAAAITDRMAKALADLEKRWGGRRRPKAFYLLASDWA